MTPATLRLARVLFRYDPARDAYVLRGVGNRLGPVLRTSAPVDTTAVAIEWTENMEDLAEHRRTTGRFKRQPERPKRVVKR